MNRALNILRAAALATVPIVGAALLVLLLQLSATVKDARGDLHAVAGQASELLVEGKNTVQQAGETVGRTGEVVSSLGKGLQGTVAGLNRTVALVNRPCGKVDGRLAPCGTLADVADLLQTGRGALGQIEVAARHEGRNLDKLDRQEDQLFADVHSTLTSFNSDIADGRLTIGKVNALLDNPAIPTLFGNAARSSTTFDHMLFTADQVATKGTHSYLHPSKNPFMRGWQATSPFLPAAAKIAASLMP